MDSVPSVKEKDEPDLSDVDDWLELDETLRIAIMVDTVMSEYGFFDKDVMCMAELQMLFWAIRRRNKLKAIASVRTMKRDHQLVGGRSTNRNTNKSQQSLARRGVTDFEAFKQHFASMGLPVHEM